VTGNGSRDAIAKAPRVLITCTFTICHRFLPSPAGQDDG